MLIFQPLVGLILTTHLLENDIFLLDMIICEWGNSCRLGSCRLTLTDKISTSGHYADLRLGSSCTLENDIFLLDMIICEWGNSCRPGSCRPIDKISTSGHYSVLSNALTWIRKKINWWFAKFMWNKNSKSMAIGT